MVTGSSVRPASEADAIDGVIPRQIVEPDDARDLASALQAASRATHVTVLRGGGTKLGWGRIPQPIDLLVSTSRLSSLLVHRHGDLTATAHAGVSLTRFNEVLATHRQWLPVESAFDGATIGGIVATNDSGPSRHRHGTPRDLLIGITLALTDGRLIKAGGHVVKNVAGYDLGKLVSGSFGTFAAIVDATFKLLPLPQASATIEATYDEGEAMARDAMQITTSQLEPSCLDVRSEHGRHSLLLQFASSPASVDAQIESAQRLLSGSARLVTGASERTLWHEQVRLPWTGPGAVVRCGWLPAKLTDVTSLLAEVRALTRQVTFTGRAGVGAGTLRIDGDTRVQAAVVERLRSSVWVGNVSVLRAGTDLKQQVDVWGPPAAAVSGTRALKQMFDPAGILNAGRGPV